MGSCPFSLAVLKIVHERFPCGAVFCASPKVQGRGHKIHATCVQQYAESVNIPVHCPISWREEDGEQACMLLDKIQPDLAIVASYGFILPQAVLNRVPHGFLNIHPSLLPRWRGASPVVSAILAGDCVTGVSLMRMDAGMDTGPLLWQEEVPIEADTDAQGLSYDLACRGARKLCDILPLYLQDRWPCVDQSVKGVCLSRKIHKEDGWLEPDQDNAFILQRKVQALNPWPRTRLRWSRLELAVLSAKAYSLSEILSEGWLKDPHVSTVPGTLFAKQKELILACAGNSFLRISQVSLPGSKALSAEDFINGYRASLACLE